MTKKLVFSLLFWACMSPNLVQARVPMEPIAGNSFAEDFSLNSVGGTKIRLQDFQGKFVLLNFWATWCAPCRNEMPALDNLHNAMRRNGLEVIGVHVGPSLESVTKFLDQVPVKFTILIDQDMRLANWGVMGLPTTFLVSPEGRLVYKAVGEREWDSPAIKKFLTGVISGHAQIVHSHQDASTESFLKQLKRVFKRLYQKTVGQLLTDMDHRLFYQPYNLSA